MDTSSNTTHADHTRLITAITIPLLVTAVLSAGGCGGRPPSPLAPDETVCGAQPPQKRCVTRAGCQAPVLTQPVCDEASEAWRCPAGSHDYRRAPASGGACLPFRGGALRRVSAGVPVAAGGGCLWILDSGTTSSGKTIDHPAGLLRDELPFGACPAGNDLLGGKDPRPVVKAGANKQVSVLHAVPATGGATVYYRLYEWDATQIYGLRAIGTGVARFDASRRELVVPDKVLWSSPDDFGNALVQHAGGLHLLGCGRSSGLTTDCLLARAAAGSSVFDAGAYRYYAGPGQWIGVQSGASVVLKAGPERSALLRERSGGYRHVFIAGFGDRLETQTAPAPEGPWTTPRTLVRCDLPADDADAYCAEPVFHPELTDPLRPDELPLTYNIRTLASDHAARAAQHPERYSARLVWVRAP